VPIPPSWRDRIWRATHHESLLLNPFAVPAILVCVLAWACSPFLDGPHDVATVVDVVDGDTIVVELGGYEETVRLIGIDTPETVHPTKPVECFGPEASAHLGRLLPPGTEVELRSDVEERDRYDRRLAYVIRHDGIFVNRKMVDDGYADVLVFEPNVARRDDLAAAKRRAREAGRGLWGACAGPGGPS
jgi:micrococcal nuclease